MNEMIQISEIGADETVLVRSMQNRKDWIPATAERLFAAGWSAAHAARVRQGLVLWVSGAQFEAIISKL